MFTSSPRADRASARPVVRLIRAVLALSLAFLTVPFLTLAPVYADDAAGTTVETTATEVVDPPPDQGTEQPPAEEPAAQEPAPTTEEPKEEPPAEEPAGEVTTGTESVGDSGGSEDSTTPASESKTARLAPQALELPDPDCTVTDFTQNTVEGGGGSWINGALNQNNSNYAEGDLVPQKIDLKGLVPGEYTIGFTFDRTKNDLYAYDYVTGLSIDGSAGASASWTSSTNPGDFDGPAPVGAATGTYTVSVTITFTITDATDSTAVIGWDGHIASELDYGPDSGAGTINGAPYHFSLTSTGGAFGCDSGSRDNQLMADAVDAGEITIVKDAQPNDAQDFHFTLAAPNDLNTAFDLDDDADGTLANSVTYRVPPGTTTAAEVNIPEGWSLTDISCTKAGTETATSVSVTLADNEAVTCTFTNTRTSTLEVDKMWVINGGAPVAEGSEPAHLGLGAQLTVDGNNEPWDTALDGYLQGTTVTLDESVTFGNDLCTWADSAEQGRVTEVNGSSTDAALPHDVALTGGANHATITNEVTCAAELVLRKVVVNENGGTAVPGDFTLVASPAGGGADLTTPGSGAGVAFEVPAGQSFDLSETGLPEDYTLTGITCGAGQVASISVPAGESRTCTFTNTDSAGSLTLVKVVDDNDTGDTTPATAWTLTATPDGIAGQDPISGTTGVSGATKAGAYDLSETGPDTHEQGTWSCVDGTDPVPVTDSEVTLAMGQDVTCTITNTAIAPQLTLVKIVDPENAQDGPEAFTLTATPVGIDGQDPVSGPGPTVSETVKIGSYDLSESGPVGYDPSEAGWTCVDGDQQPVTVTDDRVAVGVADDITCTIVNVAVPATVEVDKYWVVNGGEPMIEGTQPDHLGLGAQLLLNGNEADWDNVIGGFLRGAPITLDEEVTIGNDLCRATGASVVEVNGASADEDLPYDTTVLGGTNHYTITNEVTCGAGLTLVKVVDNGDADPTAWSLTATRVDAGSIAFTGGSTPASGTITADAGYVLAEDDADSRYVQVGPWTCTEFATLDGDEVSVAAGREATCTVHNATGELTLVKVVENPNGGTATATDWTLHAGDHAVSTGTTVFVDPETSLPLSESGGPEGYTLDGIVCDGQETASVQVPAGESVTCTFTNVDSPGQLILDKIVDANATGTGETPEDWHLSGTPEGIADQATIEGDGHAEGAVKAGTYTLAEDGPAGFTASEWTCEGPDGAVPVSEDDTIELAAIETVSCEITNTAIQPTLTLVKVVDHGDTGDETAETAFTLTAMPDDIADQPVLEGAGGASSIVKVGDYVLSETGPSTYAMDPAGWSCVDEADDPVTVTDSTVTVGLADDITCTIVNHAIPSEWMVSKTSSPPSGSTVQPGEQIDYTVTLTKVGDGVPVEDITVTDTLTGIEDAWVSGLDDGASISGGVITWQVAELGDEPLTLTYTVTVGLNAWNTTIDNVVTPGPVPCVDTGDVECDHTEHFTPHYTLDKAVELIAASDDGDDVAEPGERLRYTLTVVNDSDAVVDTVITDDLSDVLDDATVVSLDEGLTLDGTTLSWTITGLQPGSAPLERSYVVEIDDGAWDATLRNVATPNPDDGGECIPPGDLPGGEDDNQECETETVTPPVTTLVVEKRDAETGDVLSGAGFTLFLDANNTGEGSCEFATPPVIDGADTPVGPEEFTDDSGQVRFEELQKGCYILQESTTPEGFEELDPKPTMGIDLTGDMFIGGGETAPVVFTNVAEGNIQVVAKQQFEFIGGEWVPSDGVLEYGDQVKYKVQIAVTGPKKFHDITVTDFVPGNSPEDTTSTLVGTLVPGSAVCVGTLACTVSFDEESQEVTWDIGDVDPEVGETLATTAEMIVNFPELDVDRIPAPGETVDDALWNVGHLNYGVFTGLPAARGGARVGAMAAAVDPGVEMTSLRSNEVVITASLTAEEAAPPVVVPPKGPLPQTGASAALAPVALISGLLLVLGIGLSRRKE